MMSSQEVPQGYKQTKVGVVPVEWEVVTFNDLRDTNVSHSITGGPFGSDLKSEHYTKTGVRIIQLQNIGDGSFINKDFIYTSEEKAMELKSCLIYPNNIILAKMAEPVARACIVPSFENKFLMGSDGIRLHIDKNKYDNKFILESINYKQFRQIAIARSTGSTRQRIGLNDLKTIPIAIPPLKEQQKIAQILTTWDRAIEKLEALIKEKERLKKGLMQRLLSGEVRFEGFDEEWEEVKLGDIASRITTKNTDSSVDMIFSNSAVNGIVVQNEFFDKDIANRDNLTGYYIVQSSDFVYNPRISKSAPCGPIHRNKHEYSGIVSPLYTIFRINNDEIIDYFEYFFKSTYWFRYMKAIANYGARHDRMNITNNDFMKMPIPYPSKQEQQKIAQVLTTADKEIELLTKELEELKEQKRGLMQKLLTGEVRVKHD